MEFILFLLAFFFVPTLIKVLYDFYINIKTEQKIEVLEQAERQRILLEQTERLHQREMQKRELSNYKINKIRDVEDEARKRIQWYNFHSLQSGLTDDRQEFNNKSFKIMSPDIIEMVGYPDDDELKNFISSYNLALTAIQEIQNTNKILDNSFPDYNRIFKKTEIEKSNSNLEFPLQITYETGENEFAFTNGFISLMRAMIMNYRFLNTTNLDETKKATLNIGYILYQSYKEKSLSSNVIQAVDKIVCHVIQYQKNDLKSYFLGLVNGYIEIDFNLKLIKNANSQSYSYPEMKYDETELENLIENTLSEHNINVSPTFTSYIKANTM